jgi:hypothetical protein
LTPSDRSFAVPHRKATTSSMKIIKIERRVRARA